MAISSALLAVLAACGAPSPTTPSHATGDIAMPSDPHSHAEPAVARTVHLDLRLAADFEKRVLRGVAAYDLERTADAKRLHLDTDGLFVESVTDGAGAALSYQVDPRDPVLGSRLAIDLRPETTRVAIAYATAPGAAALQWLTPAQTAGGRAPFLFTQGQAILTRTWIPLQDSPGVRFTYEAEIEVPTGLLAVMSAVRETPDGEVRGARTAYRFAMEHPIPGYLMALAIGRLEFRSLGPRTGVFAEPESIERAAYEFEGTEAMMAAAERLYGPYRWGRYDILVLPPSFPFGGMENPVLTFVTPTILAGDRSLVALIAHELAHSWSGNLVTNATWQDFWLNEGFTVYFENRITEEISGREYAGMLQVLGYQELLADIETFGATHRDTCLYTDLEGRNPDDAFSNVPYEKGALFLRAIEQAVGRPRFDAFLRSYFDRHAFTGMTTDRFVELLRSELFAGDEAGFAALDVATWIHAPGMPPGFVPPSSPRLERVAAAAATFAAGGAASRIAAADWSTHEWVQFLRALPASLASEQLDDLDATFALTATPNCEKRFEWLRVCVRNDRREASASLAEFLTMQGRRKYLKPLYADLLAKDWGRPLARRIFAEAAPTYHSVSANTIEKMIEASAPSDRDGGDEAGATGGSSGTGAP
jgi:leukotriene-A4 hydrolase